MAHLLRGTRLAFHGSFLPVLTTHPLHNQFQTLLIPLSPLTEDLPLLTSARKQARSTFLSNRSLEPSSPECAAAIAHAEDVAKILRENVVQGRKEEGDERFKLRIHEHTERGDNDTVKMPNGQTVVIDGKKCSDK
ncbi:Mitochondrial zinc maintenance 1 mitochondrial protein [Rutstroemia sp. NJR-2017a BVV2]|nr:Mitochondrial zinc maintenance 1 mitochondrial protein [Rutstroemia sp. NJR-2017a BVV2]